MKFHVLGVMVISTLFCAMLVSCEGSGNSMADILNKSGLERNDLSKWHRQSYQKIGISIDLPKDMAFYLIRDKMDDSLGWAHFCLHPKYFGYVEPHYVVTVDIYILDKNQYAKYKSQHHWLHGIRSLGSPDMDFLSELKEDFNKGETVPNGQNYYRRDFRNDATGDVAITSAVYWKTIDPDPKHKELDIAAIRRILNSIQFIPKEPK